MSEVSRIRPGLYGTRCPTSDQQHARCPASIFAMMISLQLTSAALPTPDCALHDPSARTGRSSEKKNVHFVTDLFYYSVASRLPCNTVNLIVASATLAVYIPSGNSSECSQH